MHMNIQKCTYGNKCKFRHPERGPHPHKSVTERLVEHAQRHLQARGPSLSLPLPSTTCVSSQHPPLCKARSSMLPNIVQSLSSVPKSQSVENVTSDLSATNSTVYSQQIPSAQSTQGNYYYHFPNHASRAENEFDNLVLQGDAPARWPNQWVLYHAVY